MKTIGRQSQIDSIIERDTVAVTNLRALQQNYRAYVPVTTVGGRISMAVDPVIYQNVRDSIVRLALRKFYKPGGNR